MIIFEIYDKTNRKIRLTKERWSHIRQEHPMVEEDEINAPNRSRAVIN